MKDVFGTYSAKRILGDTMKQRITIDHIGIAAKSLDEGSKLELLGLKTREDELVQDQGVVTRFFPLDSQGVNNKHRNFGSHWTRHTDWSIS